MQVPKISVVMSVYNNMPYLPQAMESILGQSFGDFEFIVIDDGSTDESWEIISGYAARDARIRAMHQKNMGIVAAVNGGMKLAVTDLIARMDADDIAHADRFAKQLAYLDAHPEIGALGTWIEVIDEHGVPTRQGPDRPTEPAALVEYLRQGTPIMNPTAMIRRAVVERIGGYRSAYRYTEDYDFWLRSAEVTKIANLPERLLQYRYHSAQASHRYAVAQIIAAVAAYAAYCERLESRPDPTDGLETLPDIEELGRLFGQEDMPRMIRERVLSQIDYNVAAYRNGGTDILIEALRRKEFPDRRRALRIAARLLRAGQYGNGLRIARSSWLG